MNVTSDIVPVFGTRLHKPDGERSGRNISDYPDRTIRAMARFWWRGGGGGGVLCEHSRGARLSLVGLEVVSKSHEKTVKLE